MATHLRSWIAWLSGALLFLGYVWLVHLEIGPESDSCYQPLRTACPSGPCRSYTQSLTELEEFAATPACYFARTGRCGNLRFTSLGNGFVGRTEYFEGEQLVAIRSFFDDLGDNPECRAWTHYGRRVECQPQVSVQHCRRFPSELAGEDAAPPTARP
jgi:hypothetical protein